MTKGDFLRFEKPPLFFGNHPKWWQKWGKYLGILVQLNRVGKSKVLEMIGCTTITRTIHDFAKYITMWCVLSCLDNSWSLRHWLGGNRKKRIFFIFGPNGHLTILNLTLILTLTLARIWEVNIVIATTPVTNVFLPHMNLYILLGLAAKYRGRNIFPPPPQMFSPWDMRSFIFFASLLTFNQYLRPVRLFFPWMLKISRNAWRHHPQSCTKFWNQLKPNLTF